MTTETEEIKNQDLSDSEVRDMFPGLFGGKDGKIEGAAGLITHPDAISTHEKLGVAQRIITAPKDRDDYLQILNQADFRDEHQANLAARALVECLNADAYEAADIIRAQIVAQGSVDGKRWKGSIAMINTYNHRISQGHFGLKGNSKLPD